MAVTGTTDTPSTMTASTRTAVASTANAAAKNKITADFDTFLKMLTTQLKNQDPTDPMDSADFAVQLATFSGVEQQVKTNDLITSLTTRMTANGLADLAGWVGMEAKAKAPAYFFGDPIAIWPTIAPDAKKAEVVVKNSFGNEVGRYAIDLDGKPVSWAGKNSEGNDLPDGLYTFDVESSADGQVIATNRAEVYSLITEARMENGEAVMVLLGDAKLKASEVTSLRKQS